MLEFEVSEADHCRPLGSWLRLRMPSATAGYLGQLLKKGQVTVNDNQASELQPLLPGDFIRLKESGRTRALMKAMVQAPSVEILYEDNRVLCVNKPSGLSMHAAAEAGPETLTDLASGYLYAREQSAHPHAAEPSFKLRPVNRLDRGTSGGVILAKSSTAAGIFGKLVMEGGLGKLYLALASGKINASGEISAQVEGKEALTRYRSLFSNREVTLLALWPETGRMHQIRQHLHHIGHPVLGDRRYGGPPLHSYPGFALHAFRTSFSHPDTGAETVIHAPLPAGFVSLVRMATRDQYADIAGRLIALP